MKKLLLTTILHFIFLSFMIGQNYVDSLSQELHNLINESDIPGIGVAIVGMDTVLYQGGFGFSNMEKNSDYSPVTIQNIGSITKTTISVALMQLVETEKIKLDDDINLYLPFHISNPHHPNEKITIRQLATHTSSLTDGPDDLTIEKTYLFSDSINFKEKDLPPDYYEYFQIYKTNDKISLNKYLHNIYCPHGKWYDKLNFLESTPGTEYKYTNNGSSLLAMIIEEITNQKFSQYTKENIFEKLKMNHTYWDLEQVPKEDLASIYMSNGLLIPNYSLITYPDGGLYTNIEDFSKYLQEMIRGLNGEGEILSHESYKEIMSNQLTEENFPNHKFKKTKGLFWNVNKDGDNISMNGTDPGIDTYTLFTTGGNIGIIMFKNSNSYGNESMEKDFMKVRSVLFKYASKLMK